MVDIGIIEIIGLGAPLGISNRQYSFYLYI